MRRRAFVPSLTVRLEARALLSGFSEVSRGPVALSGLGFNTTLGRIRYDFGEYINSRDLGRLRSGLQQVVVGVPFGRVDGLGPKINGDLAAMRRGLAAGAPHAIAGAHKAVETTIRADVQARIADGSIVVR